VLIPIKNYIYSFIVSQPIVVFTQRRIYGREQVGRPEWETLLNSMPACFLVQCDIKFKFYAHVSVSAPVI